MSGGGNIKPDGQTVEIVISLANSKYSYGHVVRDFESEAKTR